MSLSKEVTITFLSCCEVDNKIYNRSFTAELGVGCKSLALILVTVLGVQVVCSHDMIGKGTILTVSK